MSATTLKRHSRLSMSRSGAFTMVELLVVMAIVSLLMAFLMPALGAAARNSRLLKCTVNMRGSGMALLNYAADNRDSFLFVTSGTYSNNGSMNGTRWFDTVTNGGYLPRIDGTTFYCPELRSIPGKFVDVGGMEVSYAYSGQLGGTDLKQAGATLYSPIPFRTSDVPIASRTMLMTEKDMTAGTLYATLLRGWWDTAVAHQNIYDGNSTYWTPWGNRAKVYGTNSVAMVDGSCSLVQVNLTAFSDPGEGNTGTNTTMRPLWGNGRIILYPKTEK